MNDPARVVAGIPAGGQFARNGRSEPEVTLPEPAPTKYDVEDARRRLAALGPAVRPMYRPDWERINGGRGPTVQQARDETRHRGETNQGIRAARGEYERLRDAYEASDKTQDLGLIPCESCGFRFSELDGTCPQCGT